MVPSRPSQTAEAVCFMRATEQARPQAARILDDPYAAAFLGPLSRAALGLGRRSPLAVGAGVVPQLTTYILCRHRLIDDALVAALARAEDRVEQVVVLGAGYDARAWRFADALAGRPVFEVDFPATQARKERILRGLDLPEVDVRRVPIDFQVDALGAVLAKAGFVPGRPTFFVWEGVSMYLRREAVVGTLETLHALGGPGSTLAMDFWFVLDDPGMTATFHRATASLLSLLGEPITFALHPEEAPHFCARHGWQVRDLADAAELARRYVRDGRRVYPANAVLIATPSSTAASPTT
ncbi:MAG: SAM-dependent methyltransferase [Pseudomonadota bacterium]|nr:SAM-dependent methyltransferase [Pseudomonadota bacterium]